jgi:phosphate transport system protein
MTAYEQRLSADKAEIRRRVAAVGERVRQAVRTAVECLLKGDRKGCARIILGDLPINRETRAINKLCHAFIARHLPSAGHLRFVSSVLQMNVALERIGDYVVTIAREGAQLADVPPPKLAEQIRAMSEQAGAVLECAMQAFSGQNADLARETKPQAIPVDRAYARVHRELVEADGPLPLGEAVALLNVCHRLERVSDQAKNICEETLFELTGETKPPKQYQILFIDARDTLIAPLAVALARKTFPDSGSYSSAGYQAGSTLAPELVALADQLPLDLDDIAPSALPDDPAFLRPFHVIVALSPEVRAHVKELPYATPFLEWDPPMLADTANGAAISSRLTELSQYLSNEIHDLLVILRGEAAS